MVESYASFLVLVVHRFKFTLTLASPDPIERRLCSLPVDVLLRMDSAEKTNQEGRDGNPTIELEYSRLCHLAAAARDCRNTEPAQQF